MQFKQIEGAQPKFDAASLKVEMQTLATNKIPLKGWNGNASVPFSNGEAIQSFGGIKLQQWEGTAEKATEKNRNGAYFVVIFNGKEIPLTTFTKMKGVLTTEGKTEIHQSEGGLAEELRKHTNDDEGLNWLFSFLPSLPSKGAKFTAQYFTSIKGDYPHEVGVYNIVWN